MSHPESTPVSSFTLALGQMRVISGDPSANLDRAEQVIAEARQRGADVVLLPETLDVGWCHERTRQLAQAIPEGGPCQRLMAAARRQGVYVVAGLAERQGDQVFNAAVLLGPDGRLLLHHRKLNEVPDALGVYDQGDRLAVAATPLGMFGVMICADGFCDGQAIARTLGYMGAQVILSPCAWVTPPDFDPRVTPYGELWRRNYRPVAQDFQMWIAGVSNVGWLVKPGRTEPWPCIGNSIVIDPTGHEAATGPFGAQAQTTMLITVTPRPRPARAGQWAQRWNRQP
jgi:predicted amidohydrolase